MAVSVSGFGFDVGEHGRVSGAIYRAPDPMQATLILAHGAGAPRTHPFMIDMATRLSKKGLDVVTFNFLYAEAERKMPDRVELLTLTWQAAIATVRAAGRGSEPRARNEKERARGGLRTEHLFIGGKSMGGRIATHIAALNEGLVLTGVVLFGYPLHPIDKPLVVREEILAVRLPMLVVQGTRDELGTADELKRLLSRQKKKSAATSGASTPTTKVHVVEGGDHSLMIPKKEGKDEQERVLDEAVTAVASFVRSAKRQSLT